MSEDGRFLSLVSQVYGCRDTDLNSGAFHLVDLATNTATDITAGIEDRTRLPTYFPVNISRSGREVVFKTNANLVVEHQYDRGGTFLYRHDTGAYSLITKRNGAPVVYSGEHASVFPVISTDGNTVAYGSTSWSLVRNMRNIYPANTMTEWDRESFRTVHTFLRDRQNASTQTITGNREFERQPTFGWNPRAISGSGRYVTFAPGRSGRGIAIKGYFDLHTDRHIELPAISEDARPFDANDRWFAFSTLATDLPGVENPEGRSHIVVQDLESGDFKQITLNANGRSWSPTMDPAGRYLTFLSYANNISGATTGSDKELRAYLHDLESGVSEPLLPFVPSTRLSSPPRSLALTLLGSDPSKMLFGTQGTDMQQKCRIYDRNSGVTKELVDNWAHYCREPVASHDGERVAFFAPANALESETASQDEAVFIYDRTLNQVVIVPGSINHHFYLYPDSRRLAMIRPALSGDGKTIAFTSAREDLASDGNDRVDVFTLPVDPLFRTDNQPPAAISQKLKTPQDEALVVVLTGRDEDGDALLYALIDQPMHGSLSGTPPQLVYTPNSGYNGDDSFRFSIDDGLASSNTATVAIKVGNTTPVICSPQCPAPLAAVLPGSRSAVVNSSVTVFATLLNPANISAEQCSIQLPTPLAIDFEYYRTDPNTNLVIGEPSPTLDIEPLGSASFVLSLTPTEAFAATELAFEFVCANSGAAPLTAGLNTLQLASSPEPVADVIAMALTPSGDGIAHAAANEFGFYVVATANVGASANVTVSAKSGAWFTGEALVCETDPIASACLQPPAASVSKQMDAQSSDTFAVFLRSDQSIPLDPANLRQFIQVVDDTGAVRGSTSVAVTAEGRDS